MIVVLLCRQKIPPIILALVFAILPLKAEKLKAKVWEEKICLLYTSDAADE